MKNTARIRINDGINLVSEIMSLMKIDYCSFQTTGHDNIRYLSNIYSLSAKNGTLGGQTAKEKFVFS
jgi:hypothetical protein